ncbi:biopolymer transporter ExbD [Desulfoluna sp.]|uniref:ExbD/TolR family protein n=1 Tax=Desulfoluna sp. TaxID=2045199 RepID=UPI0026397EC2|nr:biopolymer transporter ExbD [Desulfoluna sp.]
MITFTHHTHQSTPEVNLTPLIDIIFNLMIFLLITAVFTAKGISLNLPQAAAARPAPSQRFEITITEKNDIMVDQKPCPLPELEAILASKLDDPQWDGSEKIFIKACKEASVGQLVRVMDTVRSTGFDNVILAAGSTKQ